MRNLRNSLALLLVSAMLLTLAACGSVSASGGNAVSSTGMVPLAASASTELPFTDIPDGADYADAVAYCYEHGLMMGTASDTFDPDGSLTRAMTATIFYRMAGEPEVTEPLTFSDAKADTWYSNAVIWANSIGLMQGYGNHILASMILSVWSSWMSSSNAMQEEIPYGKATRTELCRLPARR